MDQQNMNVLDLAMYALAIMYNNISHMFYDYFVYIMQFTQECVYQFSTAQYSFDEKEREKIFFSTDVHWHCESSKDLYSVS